MRFRLAQWALVAFVIHLAASAAWAFSIGRFSFGFASPTLNTWFLWPFSIAGCG